MGDVKLVRTVETPHGAILYAQEQQEYEPGRYKGYMRHLMVQIDGILYLPVEEGMHFAIGVQNTSFDLGLAFPTFVEGNNIYVGQPDDPNACDHNGMWEVPPMRSHIMDVLYDPKTKTGKPLVVVPSDTGLGIGESVTGSNSNNGLIEVYERTLMDKADLAAYYEVLNSASSASVEGGRGLPAIAEEQKTGSSVAIGTGKDVDVDSYVTGVVYNTDAELVLRLQLESRFNLENRLLELGYAVYDWTYPVMRTAGWWKKFSDPNEQLLSI